MAAISGPAKAFARSWEDSGIRICSRLPAKLPIDSRPQRSEGHAAGIDDTGGGARHSHQALELLDYRLRAWTQHTVFREKGSHWEQRKVQVQEGLNQGNVVMRIRSV